MPKPKKRITPAAAVPQAPRSLRVAQRNRAEAPPPEAEEAPGGDEENDPDDEPDQADHDAACAAASEAMRSAADAYDAAQGTDSAAALMAAEDAGDAASEAHETAKASCLKMRGASADADAPPPPPGPPAPGAARALAALGGTSAAGQLEIAQLAALGRDVLTRTGAASSGEALLKLETAMTALAEVGKLRAKERTTAAAANITARVDRLKAAVHAGMPRAQAFNIDPKTDRPTTPKAAWMGGTLEQLDAQLNELGWKAGATADSRSTLHVAAADGEAGLVERARASGMSVEDRRAAEQNVARSRAKETRK